MLDRLWQWHSDKILTIVIVKVICFKWSILKYHEGNIVVRACILRRERISSMFIRIPVSVKGCKFRCVRVYEGIFLFFINIESKCFPLFDRF